MSHAVIQWSLAFLLLVMFSTAAVAYLCDVLRRSNRRLADLCGAAKGGVR